MAAAFFLTQRQIPPNIFWCGAWGGWGGLTDAGMWHCHCLYVFITKASAQSIVFGGGSQSWVWPAENGRLPENLISSSTSSGKALVTTELDVLVCNTFSSGGTQCVPKKCDTSSCEAPQAETHRLKSLAPPPAQQQFICNEYEQKSVDGSPCSLWHLWLCFCAPAKQDKWEPKIGWTTCDSLWLFELWYPTFQAFCINDAQYSSRCFHNDDEVRS